MGLFFTPSGNCGHFVTAFEFSTDSALRWLPELPAPEHISTKDASPLPKAKLAGLSFHLRKVFCPIVR